MTMLALAIVHLRSWPNLVTLGLLVLFIIWSMPGPYEASPSIMVRSAFQITFLSILLMGVPIRQLALGEARRVIPGHVLATIKLLLMLAMVAGAVGVGIGLGHGLPLSVSLAVTMIAIVVGLWFLIWTDTVRSVVLFLALLVVSSSTLGTILLDGLLASPAFAWSVTVGLAAFVVLGVNKMRLTLEVEDASPSTLARPWHAHVGEEPSWLVSSAPMPDCAGWRCSHGHLCVCWRPQRASSWRSSSSASSWTFIMAQEGGTCPVWRRRASFCAWPPRCS